MPNYRVSITSVRDCGIDSHEALIDTLRQDDPDGNYEKGSSDGDCWEVGVPDDCIEKFRAFVETFGDKMKVLNLD